MNAPNVTTGNWATEPAGGRTKDWLIVDEQGVVIARVFQQPYDTWRAMDNAKALGQAKEALQLVSNLLLIAQSLDHGNSTVIKENIARAEQCLLDAGYTK
jgi:hypothetical protein